MNTRLNSHSTRQQAAARAAIHDAARASAVRLRREAMNDFWSAIGRGLRSTLQRARTLLRPWVTASADTSKQNTPIESTRSRVSHAAVQDVQRRRGTVFDHHFQIGR